MKKTISFIAVLVVIAAMAGALIWQRSRGPEPDEITPPPPAGRQLIQRTESELVSAHFQGQDQLVVMLPFFDEEAERTEWMWEGVDYILNTANARNKIRGAFSLFASQVVHEDINEVEGLNLADFGLNPPLMTITAAYDDGTTTSIYLGGPTIDFVGHFLMIEGDPGLFTITMFNAERFLFGLEEIICRNLPAWDVESIEYLLVAERGREPIEIASEEHPEFEGFMWLIMQQPLPGWQVFDTSLQYHYFERFSAFRLGDLVNLHPANFADYGLEEPSLEFVYRAPHGEAHLIFGDVFFREIDGEEVEFIYVKFAGRPHVFEARYEIVSALFGMNPFRFVERFIALVNIPDAERIDISTPGADFVIYINHIEDSNDIAPTINGIYIEDAPFRLLYRLLIGLVVDSEVEPFTPRGVPAYTVVYTLFEYDNIEVRFFEYDAHFLAVSVDGGDIEFVTHRRNFDIFINMLVEMSTP